MRITKYGAGGAGGVRLLPAYKLPKVQLHICGTTATITNIYVQTQRLGVEPQDHVFGNIGQGLLTQLSTYTIDFSNMRFTTGQSN